MEQLKTGLTTIPVLLAALILAAGLFGAPSSAFAERLAISVDVANVRSGPGTDHQVLWRMERYTPIRAVSTHGDWIFFEDFERTNGWMHTDLVDDTPTVITKNDICNIRSSPGTDQEVLFQAEKGVPFRVTGRSGAWIEIEHADGDTGWIHENMVW